MSRLDSYLAWAESHRVALCGIAAIFILLVAWTDWTLPDTSVGFLYVIPILLSAPALSNFQILLVALLCAYLREAFDPLQGTPGLIAALNLTEWKPGSISRFLVSTTGFSMTGFFAGELNERRRMLAEHLREREDYIQLREEAEKQLEVLIETSPLAILTLGNTGDILLANESARQLFGCENHAMQNQPVEPYLPILNRMLHSARLGANIRTNVECKGQRRNGEVFLAHVWLSTYRTSRGSALAAVIWDASENLRDREGAGLNSMMATSRVLIGAISHEIRNLAAAATGAHSALSAIPENAASEHFHVLGTLIRGLEKIASSGLRMASGPEHAVADPGSVLDETRIVIEPSLREAGVQIYWDVAAGLPLVQADHHSLLQVFVNLARNAEQALAQREERELHISASMESDLVLVRFRDTGPGVTHPDELFRPFQPGAHSFGLGLYISRAILRAHGGGLRYEPQPSGSCFIVELWPVEDAQN